MRNITEDQCNSTEEVCGLFRAVFANQEQMETKIVQNAQEIEALKPKKKGKSKMKSKGSASMRVIAIMVILVSVVSLCYSAYITTDINYEIASNPEMLSQYLRDSFSNMTSNSYLFTPTTTTPQSTEGRVYYDDGTKAWIGYNGTSWQTFDVAGGVGLNGAYDFGSAGGGKAITVTDGAVALTNTQPDANPVLTIGFSGNADGDGIVITVSGTGNTDAIEIENTTTSGLDIEGTDDLWHATKAGVIKAAGLIVGGTDIVLVNGETIDNDINGEITFSDTTDDTSISWSGNNLQWSSDTAIDTVDWGDLDDFIGLRNLTFDVAEAGTITLAGTGTADDLTIQQTASTQDASLILQSTGTGLDAIKINASIAGIDIDAVDDIAITVTSSTDGEDLLLTQVGAFNASIILLSAGTGTDAISLTTSSSAGDIEINSGDKINMDSAGTFALNVAGETLLIQVDSDGANDDLTLNVDGDDDSHILISSDGTSINTIQLLESGTGTGGGILIRADTGTAYADAAASITLLSDVGGIGIKATGLTQANAIVINAVAGGVNIDAHASYDVAINGGQILIEAEGNVTSAISLITNTGTTETIVIKNTLGNTATAINIDATAGGITLTTGSANGILINTATYEHKVKYYPISAGYTSASQIIVGGGNGLKCVGLATGVEEEGGTEGYAAVDNETDYVRFAILLPDDFVDTGTIADLIINFDLHETTNEEVNIVAKIFIYEGSTANTTAIVDDTLTISVDVSRRYETFDTLSSGIGAVANLDAGDCLIFELSSVAAADDYNIYGIQMIYRCGLAATQ